MADDYVFQVTIQSDAAQAVEAARLLAAEWSKTAGVMIGVNAKIVQSNQAVSQSEKAVYENTQRLLQVRRDLQNQINGYLLKQYEGIQLTRAETQVVANLTNQLRQLSVAQTAATQGASAYYRAMLQGATTLASFTNPQAAMIGYNASYLMQYAGAAPGVIGPLAGAAALVGGEYMLSAGGRTQSIYGGFNQVAGRYPGGSEGAYSAFGAASNNTMTRRQVAQSATLPLVKGESFGIDVPSLAADFDDVRTIARQTGQDIGQQWEQYVNGVLRREGELLDQLGIKMKQGQAEKLNDIEYYREVRRQLDEIAKALDTGIIGADESLNQLKASFGDLWDIGSAGFAASPMGDFLRTMNVTLASSIQYWTDLIAKGREAAAGKAQAQADAGPGDPGYDQARMRFRSQAMEDMGRMGLYPDPFKPGQGTPTAGQTMALSSYTDQLMRDAGWGTGGGATPKPAASTSWTSTPSDLQRRLGASKVLWVPGQGAFDKSGNPLGYRSMAEAGAMEGNVALITGEELALILRGNRTPTGGGGGGGRASTPRPYKPRKDFGIFALDYGQSSGFAAGAFGPGEQYDARLAMRAQFDATTQTYPPDLSGFDFRDPFAGYPRYAGGTPAEIAAKAAAFQRAGNRLDAKDRSNALQGSLQNAGLQFGVAALSGDRAGMAGAAGSAAGAAVASLSALGPYGAAAGMIVSALATTGLGNLLERKQLSKAELLHVRVESFSPEADAQIGGHTRALLHGGANASGAAGAAELATFGS